MRCKTYIVADFETTSKNKYSCQPIQLAAAAIDARKLEIIGRFGGDDGKTGLIKPIFDIEKCKELGVDPITDEIYNITKIKKEDLENAREPKVVWNDFCGFVNNFNYKKSKWDAPILAGYNTTNYDSQILNRMSGATPYKFGPYDDEYQCCTLFNPIFKLDIMDVVFLYFESLSSPKSLSFDSLRQFMGMDNSQAHNAAFDVLQTSQMLIRFLRLTRSIAQNTKFEGAFGEDNNSSS